MKLPSADIPWFVGRCTTRFDMRTRNHSEAAAATMIAKAGIPVYLPMRRYEVFNRQRRLMVLREAPLLPGYLFVGRRDGNGAALRDAVRACTSIMDKPLVAGLLHGMDGPLRIPGKLVVEMHADEMNCRFDDTPRGMDQWAKVQGEEVLTYQQAIERHFAPGKEFVVREGTFQGFTAEVEKLEPNDRVRALVAVFGRLTSVEMDMKQLDDVPPRTGRAA